MAITTTAHFSWEVDNTVGNVDYKIKYRLSGTTPWDILDTSGTTIAIHGLEINRLYDFQVVNINNNDNPASAVNQSINITEPDVTISPTYNTVAYAFPNLSSDIDTYTTTIALYSAPGVILATHILSPSSTVTDTFTGLQGATMYVLTISPAANQFINTFIYTFTTADSATCAAPQNSTATLS